MVTGRRWGSGMETKFTCDDTHCISHMPMQGQKSGHFLRFQLHSERLIPSNMEYIPAPSDIIHTIVTAPAESPSSYAIQWNDRAP